MKQLAILTLSILSITAFSQNKNKPEKTVLVSNPYKLKGYDISFKLTNCNDTTVYLAKYTFDKQYIVDTCKKVKNGKVFFKSQKEVDKGIYFVVSQDKIRYFDFFLDESNKFSITGDIKDIRTFKVTGSKENEDFFQYIQYITTKNEMFNKLKDKASQMPKADSAKFMEREVKQLADDVKNFEWDTYNKHKDKFLGAVINLKLEKEPKEIPKASNGRPDSIFAYKYLRSHYWDNVNFGDDRILLTPFLADRVKRYFERIVPQIPDTVCTEIDKMLSKCSPNSDMFKFLIAYFTPTYEAYKVMGFDKVFVYIIDKYIKTGMAKDVYDDKVTKKIIERSDILKPLLIGSMAPELLMIDTVGGKETKKMGFDTARTSQSVTKLYYENVQKITPYLISLYQQKADYIILVFWDVDCGHCQKEMPELVKTYHQLKEKYNVKVFSVYTHTEFDKWKKYLIDNKLDFLNVFDPIHLNNIREKYDIFSTPVIYLLDKNKIIRAKKISHDQIPGIIKALESEKK